MHHFGAEVRIAREASGMTCQELGDLAHVDKSTVSRIEGGFTAPDENFARVCAETFGNPWFLRFWKDSRTWDALPPSLKKFTVYEQQAVTLWSFEHSLVPGLLQTEDYARSVIEKHVDVLPEQVPERVRLRLERQSVLDREAPPRYWVLIDQQALERGTAPPKVMEAQLRHLAVMARRPNITVQVVPHRGPTGAYTLLSGAFNVAQTGDTIVAYVNHAADSMTTDSPAVVAMLTGRFDALRTEAHKGSESLALIEEMGERYDGA
jgi:transcriptional regulator with XRE-family HTH domain